MTTLPAHSDKSEPLRPRAMLALIALTDQLPVPDAITISPTSTRGPVLGLHLATVSHATQWAVWLGASVIGTRRSRDGETTNVDHTEINWHGWSVEIFGTDHTATPALDADTRGRLEQLADVTPTAGWPA